MASECLVVGQPLVELERTGLYDVDYKLVVLMNSIDSAYRSINGTI